MEGIHISAVVATILGIAAFQVVYPWLRSKSASVRWVILLSFSWLSIPSLLAATYYLHFLPETEWFYEMRSWRWSEYLVIFVGGAGGAAASVLPRLLAVVPLFLTISVAVVPYLKPVMNPLPSTAFYEQWKDDACLQSTSSTCGPASVASILRSLDVDSSEQKIARVAFTSGTGTEAWYLARYVRSRGMQATFNFENGFSSAVDFPAMVGVRLGGYGHFIAVLSIDAGIVKFVDPLSGKHQVSLDDFLECYEFTGFHMTVRKRRG